MKEGDLLAGKYRIDKILGVGGMGVVVAAHHIQLDERVAIKFLLPDALNNQEAVARFAREARAAVKIKSEHVVRVSDVGTLETGAPYMVMEFLEGEDLSGWLEKRGPLPVEQAVEFVLQALEAVAEAHALGIVHRDLKPANLFALRRPDGSPSVKVLDFGISKVSGLGSSGPDLSMTKTTAVMGSPLYMSPEQMQSAKDVDARTDIWALGVILYELVTGSTAFEAESMPELVLKIMQSPPRPLRDRRADAPPGLEPVILKCLEKDRTKRYPTVAELAIALAEFGPKRARASVERISGILHSAGMSSSHLGMEPPSDRAGAASAQKKTGGTMAAWGQTSPGPLGGSRAVVGATAGGLVALVVVVAFLFGRKSGKEPGAEAPAAASAVQISVAAPPRPAEPAPPVAPAAPAAAPAPAESAVPVQPAPTRPAAPAGTGSKKPAPKITAVSAPASAKPPRAAAPPAAAAHKYSAFDDRK